MSLKHAILAVLLDGEASGYDLGKRFDLSIANFWHALPQHLYQELARMEDDGLVDGAAVLQERRPNKRVYSITQLGRKELNRWLGEPSRVTAPKSDLLVRIYAADVADTEAMCADIERQLEQHRAKLQAYEALRSAFFGDRTEEEYVQTTSRVGPYMTLRRGIMYETENITWCEWAMGVLRDRAQNGARMPASSQAGGAGRDA
ncbi:MAG TPA: PadR family transcriptional regulator [Dehalococcoidia bacterium]|nr:PadR family transcriptional regulator [Dehalococcoidia bacterium]